MGPYVIEEEVAPKTFMLRNLDGSVNKSMVNGHPTEALLQSGQPWEASPTIFRIQTTPIEAHWTKRKAPESKDMCATIKLNKICKKEGRGKHKGNHIKDRIDPPIELIDVMEGGKGHDMTTRCDNY